MRTRTRTINIGPLTCSDFYRGKNTPYTRNWTCTNSITETTDDHVTPNFQRRRAKGEIINNYFKTVKVTKIDEVVPWHLDLQWKNGGWAEWDGDNPTSVWTAPVGDLLIPPLYSPSTESQAITAAYAAMSNSTAMALVTAAEFGKTVNGLAALFDFAKTAIIGGIKTKRKLAKRLITPNQAAKAWLGYRYGLRPIMFDVKNIISAWSDVGNRRVSFYGYSSSASPVVSDTKARNCGRNKYMTIEREAFHTQSSRAGVLLEEPRYASAFDAYGVGNLLTTGWELVPFSFVIDWFLNTGDFVASYEPSAWNALGSFVTTKTTTSSFCRTLGSWYYPPGTSLPVEYESESFSVGPGRAGTKTVTLKRTPNPSKPVVPSLNINLSATKLVDLLALFRNI
jgi:hypothetical protein